MKIKYVKAKEEDKSQIINILKELNGDSADFDISRFVVAKLGSKLIGCIRVKVFEDGALELASLAVLPKYQRKGAGSELVKSFLVSETARPIFLLTSADKEIFYKKFDFSLTNQEQLPEKFKNEYLRIINLPFAKNIQVIAMVLK